LQLAIVANEAARDYFQLLAFDRFGRLEPRTWLLFGRLFIVRADLRVCLGVEVEA